MREIKVPGVLWVAIVVTIVYVLHEFFPQTQPYADIILMAVAALLKLVDVNMDDTEELMDILHRLQAEMDKEQVSASEGEVQTRSMRDSIPLHHQVKIREMKKPSKTRQWLAG